MSEKIKVLIVDDQRIARQYVDMFIKISKRYEPVASIAFAEDALEYCEKLSPDLVIIDVVMQHGIDGLTAAEMIKNRYPKIKIILATSMAETDWMSRAKQIGIESFWYKEYSNLSLIEIMDRTMDGENLYLDKPPAVFLGKLKITDLTVQQKNLLRYLTRGLSNKEIAEKMFIEPSTVKTHLDFIINKTGIHSRTELAVKAANLGLSLSASS